MSSNNRKKHMDEFLVEIFKEYIAIKDADYKRSQAVFNAVFEQVKLKMCESDNFFSKYSSQVMNAGSVYDGIKVGKLDEFDVDIVVRLPISYDDGERGIALENHRPGFVKMRITQAFDNMVSQPEWERCNRVTRNWRDTDKYFLQSKFRFWMHGLVQRAVSDLGGRVTVDGCEYNLSFKESGPAFTLNIRSSAPAPAAERFALDVDLVPVIRFMLPRWPKGYRTVEGSQVKEWLVVPKPLKSACGDERGRCWRLAFHEFEREIIKGCELLKLTIRLVKKLRDALEMKEISSYYIKTLFLWAIDENGKEYWRNRISVLFLEMVTRLCKAIEEGRISYYWHKDHNLIEGLRPALQKVYSDRLKAVIHSLRTNDVDGVIAKLLTSKELAEFREKNFYKIRNIPTIIVEQQIEKIVEKTEKLSLENKVSNPIEDLLKELLVSNKRLESKFESLIKKLDTKVDLLTERVVKMEIMLSQQTNKRETEKDEVFGEMVLNVMNKI